MQCIRTTPCPPRMKTNCALKNFPASRWVHNLLTSTLLIAVSMPCRMHSREDLVFPSGILGVGQPGSFPVPLAKHVPDSQPINRTYFYTVSCHLWWLLWNCPVHLVQYRCTYDLAAAGMPTWSHGCQTWHHLQYYYENQQPQTKWPCQANMMKRGSWWPTPIVQPCLLRILPVCWHKNLKILILLGHLAQVFKGENVWCHVPCRIPSIKAFLGYYQSNGHHHRQQCICFLGSNCDTCYDYKLEVQECMQNPVAFHAEMMGDIMYLHQALKQHDSFKFVKAFIKEVNSHVNEKHWELFAWTKVPPGIEIVPTVWAMKHKQNLTMNKVTKYKACLIFIWGQAILWHKLLQNLCHYCNLDLNLLPNPYCHPT